MCDPGVQTSWLLKAMEPTNEKQNILIATIKTAKILLSGGTAATKKQKKRGFCI